MKFLSLRRSIIFILPLLLSSCSVDGTNWDMDVTAPVVETRLDLTNLIGQENLDIASDSAVSIAVDAPFFTLSLDTLTNLPPATASYSYVWAYPNINMPGGASLPGQTSSIEMDYGGVRLTRFDVKHGKLKCVFKSTLAQRLIFHYYIPRASKNGVIFEFYDTVPAKPAGMDTMIYEKDFVIDGYEINLTGSNSDDFNKLETYVDITTPASDPPTYVLTGQVLFKCESELFEIIPEYGKGYLGQYSFDQINSTTDLSAIQMIRSGLIDVENIDLNLVFHNTIGADISFRPIEIQGVNTRNGQSVILNHPVIGSSVNINRASQSGNISNPVNETLYNFTLTSGNSNIEQLVELLPDQLSFQADLGLNPFGNTGGYNDFFYYSYPPFIQMQLNMPLKFSSANLLLADTIDNPFTSLDILDPITGGEFIVKVENKFPLSSHLQMYTLDNSGNVTDSLFATSLVAAAPVNANDRVTDALTTELIIQASSIKLQNLKMANKLKFKVLFNTVPSSSGRLQFYSDYYMAIKLIADVKFNIEL